MIPKSAKQRRREPTKEAKEARKAAIKAREAPQPVKVTRGDKVEVVPPDAFEKPPPKPPFELTGKQRRELLERLTPRIAFPKTKPCPTTKGDVLDVSSKLYIAVTGVGVSESKEEWEIHYDVHDQRGHNLGKFAGYSTSAEGSIATKKGREEQPMGGPQFRDETEQEAVSKVEQEQISGESRADRITRLKARRVLARAQLREMEGEDIGSEVLWGLRLTIQRLTERIEHEERSQGSQAQEAA
jgi:hypothetical protein